MRHFSLFLSLLFHVHGWGQIAVIQDQDGFTNVRQSPSSKGKVIYKILEDEVFIYDELKTNSDWVTVYISKHKFDLSSDENSTLMGYVHKSRLLPVDELTEYKGNNFLFKYKLGAFSSEDKILDYHEGKWLVKVNGRRFYGTDGALPKVEIKGIEVSLDGNLFKVPDVFYGDLFECNTDIQIHKHNENYIVHHWNSDGAGGYLLVWVFDEKELSQRLIWVP